MQFLSEHLLITDRYRTDIHLNTSGDTISVFLFFHNSFANKGRDINDPTGFLEKEQSQSNIC